jgi:hypothetical protein
MGRFTKQDKAKAAEKAVEKAAAAAKKVREERLSQLDRTPPKRVGKAKKAVQFSPVGLTTRRRMTAEDSDDEEDGEMSDVGEVSTREKKRRQEDKSASPRKKRAKSQGGADDDDSTGKSIKGRMSPMKSNRVLDQIMRVADEEEKEKEAEKEEELRFVEKAVAEFRRKRRQEEETDLRPVDNSEPNSEVESHGEEQESDDGRKAATKPLRASRNGVGTSGSSRGLRPLSRLGRSLVGSTTCQKRWANPKKRFVFGVGEENYTVCGKEREDGAVCRKCLLVIKARAKEVSTIKKFLSLTAEEMWPAAPICMVCGCEKDCARCIACEGLVCDDAECLLFGMVRLPRLVRLL